MDKNESVEWLIEHGVCSADEYSLVADINGDSMQTVNDILYARTGYHSIEQLKECENVE